MNLNIYALFAERFMRNPAQVGIETETGKTYSYADVERETAKLANLFTSIGAQKGDRVAAQVEKSAEALFVYLAVVRAGLVYLPLNVAYQRGEMEYFLGDAQPVITVCRPQSLAVTQTLAHVAGCKHVFTLDENSGGTLMHAVRSFSTKFQTVPVDENDLAAILYTSGTTGRSKGAMLSHKNLASNVRVLHSFWGFKLNDVLLHTLPIFHIHGLFVAANLNLYNGSRMFFLKKFDTLQIIDYIEKSTIFMGVPTYYVRLLTEKKFDKTLCRNMRLFVSGSAPLLQETFDSFKQKTGHTILERYGMSETGMNTSNPLNGECKGGTVGFPLPGTHLRIADDKHAPLPANQIGGIEVKGDNVFSGYWRMLEKTREEFTADGYFKTGDVGKMDEQGYVSIVGRSKDLVISGGYNVYPKEVEKLIDAMPGVVESAVIGVPHPDFGEAVTAVVVKKKDANGLTEVSIIQALKKEIANYKVPKKVFFVDDLPRNAMGKVQKNVLRETYGTK
ncbi:MAG: malonyl-CoA synthase [Burkholderiales bacterium]